METCKEHKQHSHGHGENCGHKAINHEGHTCYLHDGHLHHVHDNHVDEHKIPVSAANPAKCTEGHECSDHEKGHTHGPNCGHEAVPHGDHVDYLINTHLHHFHNGHCDNHGKIQTN